MKVLAVLLTVLVCTQAQIYNPALNLIAANLHNPPPVDPSSLVNREVVENAAREAQLPQELLNPFYKNPHVAAGLAKESWLANKEFPVFHRETEDIPRAAIAKLVHNAGFFRQRRK